MTHGTEPEPFGRTLLGWFLGLRIESSHPALSSWEQSLLCLGGDTYTFIDGITKTSLSEGLRIKSSLSFAISVITYLIKLARPAPPKSVTDTGVTGLLACASSELMDDLDKLVLTSYLKSREKFRETTLLGPRPGMSNSLESANGDVFSRSADFFMFTDDATATSYSALITSPFRCIVATLLAAMLPLSRKLGTIIFAP